MRVALVGPPARRERLRPQLPEGLEVVAEGATLADVRGLGPEMVDAYVVTTGSRPAEPPLIEPLTARETEVLTLLADGLSNKAIASRLGVSDETVKFHLTAIFGKLHASNRTDAVRQALRRGLVPL